MELQVKGYGMQGAELIIKGDSVVVTEDVTREDTIIENLREVANELAYILDNSFVSLEERYELLEEELNSLKEVIKTAENIEEIKEFI